MCKETTPGWFNIGSSWRISCDNGGRVWSILAMLATGLAWFGINYVGSGEYDAYAPAHLRVARDRGLTSGVMKPGWISLFSMCRYEAFILHVPFSVLGCGVCTLCDLALHTNAC
eukprot:687542-Rhodomonas_salina.1